ncbi:hypothetical protein P152DRAFT_435015 [Eremomyces bilateralis CBS 781.70]|uniref:Mitochondrial F1F0 ATP synthase subunit Atp14 n=1 Tax=Eremomyces bilateralis CBS 781.70 TaxID=1392243 RepID=A0A6G1G4A6_9PEZI|nr:uncharacterized protein P152DRAFT_435015 [Eremomyces bilateralis CBS 781.70]KAF1812822.1 hypothetical protein P152DRAFT_435015 [Eremomyces bilateralis CBS 781.70]
MLAQSLRVSRQCVARLSRQQLSSVSRRTLTVSAVRQADLVQDIYLRELRNFKPAPVKATDAEGHVHTFSMPKVPASPEEADLAKEMQAYETQAVEVEGQAEEGGQPVVEEDWFVEEEEEAASAQH